MDEYVGVVGERGREVKRTYDDGVGICISHSKDDSKNNFSLGPKYDVSLIEGLKSQSGNIKPRRNWESQKEDTEKRYWDGKVN